MRYLKLSATSAVLALTLTASLGVGSAAAEGSEFCTVTAQKPCFHENMVMEGSTITAKLAKGTSLRLTNGFFGDVVCTESITTLKTLNTGSTTEHVDLELEAFTVGAGTCKFGGNACAGVKTTGVGGGKEAVNGEFVAGLGTITLERNTNGVEWGIVGSCGALNCTFRTGKLEVSFAGGSPASLDVLKQPIGTSGGPGCPGFFLPEIDFEYEITSPKSLFGVVR
jgi:hypothetical protein